MRPDVTYLMGLVLLVSGCVQTVPPRNGPSVTLSPETGSMTVSITEKSLEEQVVRDFVKLHWSNVSTQGIALIWHTPAGEKWVRTIKRSLLERGMDIDLILLRTEQAPKLGADFTLSSTSYIISADRCKMDDVYNLGQNELGCTLETLRWSSMVNPQKVMGD